MSTETIDLTPVALDALTETMTTNARTVLGMYNARRLNAIQEPGDSGEAIRAMLPEFTALLRAELAPLQDARDAIVAQLHDGLRVAMDASAAGVFLESWARLLNAPATLAEQAKAFGFALDPTW